MNKKNRLTGFSLIEVLVFVSILALFFVAAIAVVAASLRNIQINEHKIIAAHYAEELSEWIGSQKEINWNDFVARSSATPYCFKNLSWVAGPCGATDKVALIFTRQAIVTANGDSTQVTVAISVSWMEPGGTYKVPINNVYRIWE